MGTKHLDRGSLALRLLIAGLFGSSLLGVNQAFAQASSVREHADDGGLSLLSSGELSPRRPTRSTKPIKTVLDRDPPLLLSLSPVLGALAPDTSSLARRAARAGGGGDTPALLSEVSDEDTPYDPTQPGAVPAVQPVRPPGRRATAAGATPAGAVSPTQDDAAGASLGWGLAPMRWGGQLGALMRRNSSSDGGSSSDIQEYINLRAASYIYQPWFAQINGNFQLSANQGNSSGGNGETSSQDGKNITGGGTLRLFPISRFPFQASFDRSDSRNSSDFVSTAYTNTRYGFRQSYRPEDGAYALTGGYDTSTINSNSFGEDTVGSWFGNFSRNTDIQSMQGNLNYSQSTRSRTGDESRLISFDSRHTYQVQENITYDSLANITDNTLNYTTPAGASTIHGRYMQFNSSVTWRPEDEEIPLFVTGGLRTLSALNETNGTSTDSQSMGLNLSANYTPSPNLSFNGNGLVTRLASSATDAQVLTLVGGSAVYTGDPLSFGNYSYNWNTGASASYQSGSGEQGGIGFAANKTVTGQFNHNINRAFNIDSANSWYLMLGQSLSDTSSTQVGNTASLTHTAGVTYRAMAGEAYSGTASLNANDMLTTGANASHFRYLNLQLNGQAQFSSRSTGSVNLTFQWSAQDSPQVQDASTFVRRDTQNSSMNVFGSAVYQHQRAFAVPGLRYTMSFNANTLARDDRLTGDVNGSIDRITYSVDNRFDYRIGLLDFQLRGLVTESAGKKNALIFFKVTRDFGRF